MFIKHQNLHQIMLKIITAAGSSPEEAQIVADHLLRANLTGHDSHGVGMLPTYLRSIGNGLLIPNTSVKAVSDSGTIMVFDGQRGYGQRVAREAMEQAINRCQETGLVLMALRHAHHIGRVGTYGEQSIAAGVLSLHFVNVTNHPPVVAVYNGADARLLTNPICFAMPGTEKNPEILLDMATSKIALGKARVAMNSGKDTPEGAVLDGYGNPSNDPSVLFHQPTGALKPFGRHKGFGIAFFCELLAGALSGGNTIQPEHPKDGSIINNMMTIIIDPKRLVDQDYLHHEMDALIKYILDSPQSSDADEDIMLAGEPERRSMSNRLQTGIPVDSNTWDELLASAASVGINPETLKQFI
ncbi:uncharacterized oxidoreductase [Desulfuromusa kysingii]|uniref:Uncharacterized oxidoreductase n=1 Tax=Desulfuromusa kysingii TaxID=37625 RepID=A0A1H4BZN6_9BACT|nr:malate/lactate/ureidoglycolate dehydrogenase [Desulfuromusa kysingii]SEA53537.1 uncharacterized oxidoreductase [Desulfuromusa kysingii]